MAIARGGIAVSGSYQASKRNLNVHLNRADSKNKARPAISQCLLLVPNISITIKFPGEKMFKKISNAEWAKIAARAMKMEERALAGRLCRQSALREVSDFGNNQVVEV